MLYTEKEKHEIERVKEVFAEHLRQSPDFELLWSDKVGYVWLTIGVNPVYVDTGIFHLPLALKQSTDMPLAVFKILFLNHIALSLCCIVSIVSTAVMDMEHGVSLPCRKQNITAVVDR